MTAWPQVSSGCTKTWRDSLCLHVMPLAPPGKLHIWWEVTTSQRLPVKYGKGTLDVPAAGAASESASALLTLSLSTRAISKASAPHMASTAPLHQDTPTYQSR